MAARRQACDAFAMTSVGVSRIFNTGIKGVRRGGAVAAYDCTCSSEASAILRASAISALIS
jgi:hypothetical protein